MKTILILDDYNNKILWGGVIGTITLQFGDKALRNGNKIIEIHEDSEPDRPPRTDDMFDEGKK